MDTWNSSKETIMLICIRIRAERNGYCLRKHDYKKKSGAYVPSGNYNIYSRMEALLLKFGKGLERQECFLEDIKAYIFGLR